VSLEARTNARLAFEYARELSKVERDVKASLDELDALCGEDERVDAIIEEHGQRLRKIAALRKRLLSISVWEIAERAAAQDVELERAERWAREAGP
jgi:hypothetical protein